MKPQRVKTGFHRIGVVLAAFPVVTGIANDAQTFRGGEGVGVTYTIFGIVVGTVIYAIAIGIGWIIAGFSGDNEKNSN